MNIPLTDTNDENRLRMLIRDETNQLLMAHLKLCPFVGNEVEKRLRNVETKTASIMGIIIGSNLLGVAAGATIAKTLF